MHFFTSSLGSEGRRARNSKLYPQLHSESEANLDHMRKQSKTKEHTFLPSGATPRPCIPTSPETTDLLLSSELVCSAHVGIISCYRWSHTACDLLCLASFTEHVFETHPLWDANSCFVVLAEDWPFLRSRVCGWR